MPEYTRFEAGHQGAVESAGVLSCYWRPDSNDSKDNHGNRRDLLLQKDMGANQFCYQNSKGNTLQELSPHTFHLIPHRYLVRMATN